MIELSKYGSLTPTEAIAYQKLLREKTELRPLNCPVKTIAGADISFNKYSNTVYAGIVVLDFITLQIIQKVTVKTEVNFPYITGLLAFREVPALIEAWDKLNIKPDVLVTDGQGIAHPRRVGIATHFGIITATPTIGCGKTRLTGKFTEPGRTKFSESLLIDKEEVIGSVLRTKENCKPVFISPGNYITHQESVEVIKNCVGRYRVPEPTRLAHLLVNQARVKEKGN